MKVLERAELGRVDEVGEGVLEDDGDVGEVEVVPRPVGESPGVVDYGCMLVCSCTCSPEDCSVTCR